MYASLSYVQTRHPYASIEGQPSQAPAPTTNSTNPNATNENGEQSTPPPETPVAFESAMRELAQDLVVKEQQIEYLVNSLPGIGTSEAQQERRMRELEVELRAAEKERAAAEVEKETMVEGLGKVLVGVRRGG